MFHVRCVSLAHTKLGSKLCFLPKASPDRGPERKVSEYKLLRKEMGRRGEARRHWQDSGATGSRIRSSGTGWPCWVTGRRVSGVYRPMAICVIAGSVGSVW
jgi:hypothetical protein